jgi:hypothetical protein
VTLRARWVTLRARWVTLRARWVTLRARWVTLRARWVMLRARWVTRYLAQVDARARDGIKNQAAGFKFTEYFTNRTMVEQALKQAVYDRLLPVHVEVQDLHLGRVAINEKVLPPPRSEAESTISHIALWGWRSARVRVVYGCRCGRSSWTRACSSR